jgi:fructokinase
MSTTIAVIGEAVADAIVDPAGPHAGALTLRVLPGGGPLNTAVALGRLGTPTQFLGRLAGGQIGQLLREHLVESNVDLSASVRAAEPPTLAIAAVGPDGQAAYEFYVNGTADWQWTEKELSDWQIGSTVAVHAASLALTQQPGASAIHELLARVRPRTTISIDPNVRTSLVPPQFYRDAIHSWASLAHILRLSQDDLDVVMPGVPLDEACARLHDAGTSLVVVTRGPDGAHASLPGRMVHVPAAEVELIDTVGAGDSFTAGLLHWLHRIGALTKPITALTIPDLTDAMRFAATVAAHTCQRHGADPPWARDLQPSGAPPPTR